MSKFTPFWNFFKKIEGQLQHRGPTFRKMFEHVDCFDGPVMIVETGCTRLKGNWVGDETFYLTNMSMKKMALLYEPLTCLPSCKGLQNSSLTRLN